MALTMDCLSLFVTQNNIPIAFLEMANLRVGMEMEGEGMMLKVEMAQLYGTSI